MEMTDNAAGPAPADATKTNQRPVSEAQLEQRQQAAVKHGIHAFEARGPLALDDGRLSRLAELRQMVRSHPGRMELREELTARTALIVDLAMSELITTHEAGKSIWESPVIKRAGTYLAELRRLLDSFPPEKSQGSAADIIGQIIENGRDS
ncbi:MAG: hypothetical protein L0322_25310 [Chloroflexi bacterium]|nr:hypothetical protein [Chloroflexota bacterium]MCI0644955.1 hypothetical protein [Chloroflexota bacterium]